MSPDTLTIPPTHLAPLNQPIDSNQDSTEEKPYLTIRPSAGWAAINIKDLWQFRDLLMSLASRDLKLRYKQTALGVTWVVLQPLLAAGIFTFVFGKLAKMPSHGVPYFVFSYVGLLGWNLFSSTLTKSSNCLVGNSQLISKVFFPRLVLPLSTVPSVMVDFAVAAGMLIVLMIIYHCPLGLPLLLLPIWMAVLLLLALGIGLCSAALSVSYRDVQYILPVFLQILLYASPVAYALSFVLKKLHHQWAVTLYLANPLSSVLEAFRWSVLDVTPPPPLALLYSVCFGLAMFLIGAYSFKRMERKFADVI